jgi:hypothetical protein
MPTCPQGNDPKNNIIANYCTDTGAISDLNSTNLVVPDTVNPDPNNPDLTSFPDDFSFNYSLVTSWLQSLGGTGNIGISIANKQVPFINPEYSGSPTSIITDGGNGSSVDGSTNICNGGNNPAYIVLGARKQANYGDPLQCCLRDFQCNEGSNDDINGASCFSDNTGFNTCPSSFRATDTAPCQFLTTQYCLGNIGDTIDPASGLDFTALWVDTTDELVTGIAPNETFKIYSLPIGYSYKLNENWTDSYDTNNIVYPTQTGTFSPDCQLDPKTGLPVTKAKNNIASCSLNATVSSSGYNPAIPYGTDSSFNFQGLPPCQSIFWRTLYGNEPTFQNQYWTTDTIALDSNGTTTNQSCPVDPVNGAVKACETTSNAPQGAACSASPFAGIPTPSGVDWARTTLNAAVSKIKNINNGQSILTPYNLQTNAPFFSWLYSVCSSYPYLCSDFLTSECSAVTQSLIDDSPGVRNWCGCYLPSSFYDQYTNDFINQECTPYCNSSSVIPMSQPDGTAPLYCEQSVCIIDDVAITLARTEFEGNGGSINFNQMCGSCGSNYQNSINKTNLSNTGNIQTGSVTTKNGSNSGTIADNTSGLNSTLINDIADITCQCRINNFSLTSLGGSFVGGINLAQSCGGNSKCYGSQTDPLTGQTTSSEVDCSNSAASVDLKVQNLKASLAKKAESTSNSWSILIVFIVFALIIIIWLFFVTRGVPEKDLTFSRNVINTSGTVPSSSTSTSTRTLMYKGPSTIQNMYMYNRR